MPSALAVERPNWPVDLSDSLLRLLEAAEARFHAFIEAVPDGIVVVDQEARIVLVNRQTEVLFGYERHELQGQPVEVLVPERFRADHIHHRTHYLSAPVPRPLETGMLLWARHKDGTEFPIDISLSPVVLPGEGARTIAIVRDITERVHVEEERLAMMAREQAALAEADRLKDEFLAGISHDLRGPITGIKSSIGVVLANEPPGTPEPLHRLLANIDLSADRMDRLVADLVDLARLQGGRLPLNLAPVDLRDVVRRAVQEIETVAQSRGQYLDVQVPPEPVWTTVDAAQMERVLLNLLGNAAKYGPENGRIGLLLDPCAHEALLSVIDEGPGIPPAEQARIFDRFYRGASSRQQSAGVGLGLTIARTIAERHGGRIWVESAPGAGATFFVALPINPTGLC
jgi:PAS domain S-box-containing protein